ncbi:hypothetical protein HK096_001256, partial [Nowakowskiella sp. JEL0078]
MKTPFTEVRLISGKLGFKLSSKMKSVKSVWMGRKNHGSFCIPMDQQILITFQINSPKKLVLKDPSEPTILAFSGDCYFVQFPGVEDTELSDHLDDDKLEQVEFGTNGCASYFVKISDGRITLEKKKRRLYNKINGVKNHSDVKRYLLNKN